MPRHMIFFDTETSQHKQDDGSIEQRFKLGWAVYWRRPYGRHKEVVEWCYIDHVGAFWDFVYSKCGQKTKVWVIARNVVFDFTICRGWEHLRREGYKCKFFHNNGVSAIVTVKKKSSTIVFLDSMNWFTESLAKTGKRIGIPKMKINFDTCTMQELSDYCKNDVLIELENFRIFIAFLQDNMIGRLCYTKASTAMAAYLFRHYHTDIYIHNNAEAIVMERESYKGGRCECFVLGDLSGRTFHVLDVNSLYPYVMKEHKYPHKWYKLSHPRTPKKLAAMLKSHAVVARVRIHTDKPVYAIKKGRTIFPVGTFDTTLCTPELQYAIDHGHVVKVYDVVEYEQAPLFASYVTSMYAQRQTFKAAGNKEYEQICKYLLNSLYGKFGQKAEEWIRIGTAPGEPDREEMILYGGTRKSTRLRYLLGEVFELKRYTEAFNSFPAIAAHVTAYARVYLWSLMEACGHGNYVYCDTDSLMVTDVGLANLSAYLSDTVLGKLKCEKTVNRLIIRGLKDYTADEKVVVKGVRKSANLISDGVYTQEQWPSFKGIFKSTDVNTYVVKNVTKHLTREYTKGTVGKNGIITPFVM
jgi:hypothetical protein